MYADDTKLYREIREPRDHEILQEDLNKLSVWSDLWLLKFHTEKCFSLTIGKQDEDQFAYHMMIDKTKTFMTKVEDIKDIGVTIDCHLKFEKNINGKIVTDNKLVGIIRRSFMFLNEEIFVPLYKSTIGNTRVSVAYYSFYDNIQLYEPLGKALLFTSIS